MTHLNTETNESAPANRVSRVSRAIAFGLVAVILACIGTYLHVQAVSEDKVAAEEKSVIQAETTSKSGFCQTYPDEPFCIHAKEILKDPAAPKPDVIIQPGKDGRDGRGVSSFTTSSEGNLLVTFDDGFVQNVGRVAGPDGKSGKDGRGVSAVSVSEGALVVSFTDGKSQILGPIVGPAGANGKDGAAGTNGKDGLPGKDGISGKDGLPGAKGDPGERGVDGVSVKAVTVTPANEVIVTYSNDTTSSAGFITVPPPTVDIACENDTLSVTVNGVTDSVQADCTPDTAPAPPAEPQDPLSQL